MLARTKCLLWVVNHLEIETKVCFGNNMENLFVFIEINFSQSVEFELVVLNRGKFVHTCCKLVK